MIHLVKIMNLKVELQIHSATFLEKGVYLIIEKEVQVDVSLGIVQSLQTIMKLQVLFDDYKKGYQEPVFFIFSFRFGSSFISSIFEQNQMRLVNKNLLEINVSIERNVFNRADVIQSYS